MHKFVAAAKRAEKQMIDIFDHGRTKMRDTDKIIWS